MNALMAHEPRLYKAIERLNAIYADPNPGLFTWQTARHLAAQEIINAINEKRTEKERNL